MTFDLPKAQVDFMREKFGYKYKILKDLVDIRKLEQQDSITSEQLSAIVEKEQIHLIFAKRLRNLRNKKVRG